MARSVRDMLWCLDHKEVWSILTCSYEYAWHINSLNNFVASKYRKYQYRKIALVWFEDRDQDIRKGKAQRANKPYKVGEFVIVA